MTIVYITEKRMSLNLWKFKIIVSQKINNFSLPEYENVIIILGGMAGQLQYFDMINSLYEDDLRKKWVFLKKSPGNLR